MQAGPKAESGFDLALTELLDDLHDEFLVEVGSTAGAEVLERVPHRTATDDERARAAAVVAHTRDQMGRRLETAGIKDLLLSNLNHSRWDDVAQRCLTCGNCTMVCPTCFCTTVEDHNDLSGTSASRVRKWDSCFTLDHSFIHGGSVRSTPRSRYRQWITASLRPGLISSVLRDASAAVAALLGVRSGSTSRSKPLPIVGAEQIVASHKARNAVHRVLADQDRRIEQHVAPDEENQHKPRQRLSEVEFRRPATATVAMCRHGALQSGCA
jgi:ferredoxin